MYELAKKARSGMKSKAERLAGEKDRKTDSSDWSPAEPLNADVKTGMRPVSRKAFKAGGKVDGCATPMRADRKARKSGGRVEKNGEQPLVDRYVNRDLKKANEYRDGKKHVGGLKNGGRAKKQQGGASGSNDAQKQLMELIKKSEANQTEQQIKDLIARDKFGDKSGNIPLPPRREFKSIDEVLKAYPEKKSSPPASSRRVMPPVDQMGNPTGMKKGGKVNHSDVKEDKALIKKIVKSSAIKGERAKKADGGPMMQDPRLGIVKNKAMEFGQNVVTPGLKNGGRTAKASGGSAEFKTAFRAARNAFMAGEGPKNFEFKGKSYSTDLYKPTTGPATRGGTSGAPRQPVREKIIDVQFGGNKSGMPKTDQLGNPNQGMKKGGRIKKFGGGALGMSSNAMMNPSPYGMGRPSMPPTMPNPAPAMMTSASSSPMMMPPSSVPLARANGGRTKAKGKTNINIIIAAGGKKDPESMVPTVPPAPMGAQPVPVPAAPPAAPMGAGAPPAAPMLGGAPAGPPAGPHMPPMPRKSGGRVSKVAHSYKDMTAGAGSGEGRLQKTDIAKRSAHKSGGKVYRSYKDMDAGAGSGEGRLEKTAIQKRKH